MMNNKNFVNPRKFTKLCYRLSLSSFGIIVISFLIFFLSSSTFLAAAASTEQVKLTALFAEPKDRWDQLVDNALQKLNERHPDKEITVEYSVLPYSDTRTQILTIMAGRTPLDLVSVDQIWLGEFAEAGFLSDLTAKTKVWNKSSDWFESNWLGGIYNNKVHGIWAWTDVRAIWYWKDLLAESKLDPQKLDSWDGYISAHQQLSQNLTDKNIQPVHLTGASHAPDMWYPYLWMLGGNILELRDGHPTKDKYWYPVYNDEKGVKALEFLKNQIAVGIKPQINHFWGQEFADRKFAVMIEGSWILGHFPRQDWSSLEEKIGLVPMFPVPNPNTKTSTMMGGWLLSIPETSQNKDLAWELITIMLEPDTIIPMLLDNGYLPTQKSIAEGNYSEQLRATIPYYEELVSLIESGKGRPNIPEYPSIAEHMRIAIEEVYQGKDPKQALDEATQRSLKSLGWQ